MLTYSIRKNPKNPVLITVPHSGSFYPELFKKYIKFDDYDTPYLDYSPEIIMEKFNKIFLS